MTELYLSPHVNLLYFTIRQHDRVQRCLIPQSVCIQLVSSPRTNRMWICYLESRCSWRRKWAPQSSLCQISQAKVSDTHFKVPLMSGKTFRLHDIKECHFSCALARSCVCVCCCCCCCVIFHKPSLPNVSNSFSPPAQTNSEVSPIAASIKGSIC